MRHGSTGSPRRSVSVVPRTVARTLPLTATFVTALLSLPTAHAQTQCPTGFYQSAPATPTTNRVCSPFSAACTTSQYESAPPTPTSDRNCSDITPSCASTTYQAAAPTATTDRQCVRYSKCRAGSTVQEVAPTPTSDRVCRNATTCTSNEYEVTPPTLLTDRECNTVSACANPSQYIAVSATATTDRTCGNTTVCNRASYQSTPVTPTTDAVCTNLTACPPLFSETVPATYTSDRQCALVDVHNTRFVMSSSENLFEAPGRLSGILPGVRAYVLSALSLPANTVTQSMAIRSSTSVSVLVVLPRFSDVVALRNNCAAGSFVVLAEDTVLTCVPSSFVPAETTTSTTLTTTTATSTTTTSSTVSTSTVTSTTATSTTATATTATQTTATATTRTTSSSATRTTTVTTRTTTTTSTTTTSTVSTSTTTSSTMSSTATDTVTTATATSSTSTVSTAVTATTQTATSQTVTTTIYTTTTVTDTTTTSTTTTSTTTTSTVTSSSTVSTMTSTQTTTTSTVTNSTPVGLSASSDNDIVSGSSEWAVLIVGVCLFVAGVVLVARNRRAKRGGYTMDDAHTSIVVNRAMKTKGRKGGGATATTLGLDAVGSRVTVVGYPGEGTLRYYGRHAYQPGFRCGVELDGPHGHNDGSVKGYYYFACPERHGVLVDVRKVALVGGGDAGSGGYSTTPLPNSVGAYHGGGDTSIGDNGIADGDSQQTQINSLKHQLNEAESIFAEQTRRRPDAQYQAADGSPHKNRYRDIAPYDDNRIVLNGNDDYINASYVRFPSPAAPLNAICCQGPKNDTVDDMWRMLSEQQVEVIVMVTNLQEGMSDKCARYWPEAQGETETYGDCEVTWLKTQRLKGHDVRELQLKWQGSTRVIKHVQFYGWPDHGVPTDALEFLDFVGTVERQLRTRSNKQNPFVVHCSAGVGRTGVFLMLYVVLDKLRRRIIPNLADILAEFRRQRMLLVQTPSQFSFCHEAAIAALERTGFEYF
eukprot:m.25878 g.25878  ORF g.25878 m.25878 type:complete len:987 (+) comp4275_c0_seq1:391-3351(+)